ncbi:MAG: adenosylmethionine--8-amino-7-oxononanoate transaminase [Desulfurivibrionaceae bacterium]|nr:adenosylmethionine--8-amino-7-oxononanoate transaminase [Desulfurivibrionaceae bacterium]
MKETIDNPDLDFDRLHIWHPYSTMLSPPPVWPVTAAGGSRLTLADGRELVDGMSSWWSVIHGYNHPRLNRAAHEQIDAFAHVMFGGLTHNPAIELARRLVAITPEPLDKVFISDSGSVAVEVAIKMAVQYWHARNRPEKHRLLTIRGGYHGDTFAAMSVCDPVTGMHEIFTHVLAKQFFAPRPECRFGEPWDPADIQRLAGLLAENHGRIAALILEPVVQGAGGMWFYSPEYLKQARALCDAHEVLLIADEIATGFGRTGRLFACEHAGIAPDILCLGKAMTGGYLSLAATLTSSHIAETISASGPGCFMHGPTFMGNPLACRVACESIDLLLESPWRERIASIEEKLRSGLAPCREFAAVKEVRVLGAIGVVELHEEPDHRALQRKLVDKLVWIRPFSRLVYIMPAYNINPVDLGFLIEKMVEAVGEL